MQKPEKTVEQIRALADPQERWQAAEHFKGAFRDATYEIADIRRQIVAELRAAGLSLGQIAEKLDISRARVQRLTMTREQVTERRRDDG